MEENNIISVRGGVSGWNNRRKIRINNFRSIKMDDFIDIKKITLLFGKNGSGKSSFIKAIKFLGQNLFPAQSGQTIYNLEHNIDLGDFKQIVFQNKLSHKISIDFEEYWESYSEFEGERKSNIFNYRLNNIIENNEEGKNFRSIKITDLISQLEFETFPSEKNKYDENFVVGFANRETSKKERELLFERIFDKSLVGYSGYPNNSIEMNRNIKGIKSEFKKFIKYLDILPFFNTKEDFRYSYYNQLAEHLGYNVEQRKTNEYFIDQFINKIPLLAKKFFIPLHISSTREKPLSSYNLVQNKFDIKDYYGILNQIDVLNQSFNPHYPGNGSTETILEFINRQLQKLELAAEVKINKFKGKANVSFVDKFGVEVNLAEASSGLIQLFPIITAAYNALYNYEDFVTMYDVPNTSDLTIIEQPELHLHPSLQSKLVDFISGGMGSYIIETHSEHIVRKLQVLIAQGKLSKKKVAVYYFDKDDKTGITSIKEMKLDERGRFLDDWPPGFFDTDTELALEFFREISKN